MKDYLKLTALVLFSVLTINMNSVCAAEQTVPCNLEVKPLELVENPAKYLNKEIQFSAEFDKFSTLGLDYNRAFRDSKDYISFLIKKPGIDEGFTIPLSELKLIFKREEAEKMLDIESGDRVIVKGKVFSTALNDPWVDVYELKNLDPDKAEEEE